MCLTHPQVDSQVGNVFAAFHVNVVVVLFLLRIVCVEPQINNWTKPMCCLPALICDVWPRSLISETWRIERQRHSELLPCWCSLFLWPIFTDLITFCQILHKINFKSWSDSMIHQSKIQSWYVDSIKGFNKGHNIKVNSLISLIKFKIINY